MKFVTNDKKQLQMAFYRLKREELLKQQNNKCYYCTKQLNKNDATMDHIIPLKETRYHTDSNVVVSCNDCNSEKGHRKISSKEEVYIPKDRYDALVHQRLKKFDESIRIRTLKAIWKLDMNVKKSESFRKWYLRKKKDRTITF